MATARVVPGRRGGGGRSPRPVCSVGSRGDSFRTVGRALERGPQFTARALQDSARAGGFLDVKQFSDLFHGHPLDAAQPDDLLLERVEVPGDEFEEQVLFLSLLDRSLRRRSPVRHQGEDRLVLLVDPRAPQLAQAPVAHDGEQPGPERRAAAEAAQAPVGAQQDVLGQVEGEFRVPDMPVAPRIDALMVPLRAAARPRPGRAGRSRSAWAAAIRTLSARSAAARGSSVGISGLTLAIS